MRSIILRNENNFKQDCSYQDKALIVQTAF